LIRVVEKLRHYAIIKHSCAILKQAGTYTGTLLMKYKKIKGKCRKGRISTSVKRNLSRVRITYQEKPGQWFYLI